MTDCGPRTRHVSLNVGLAKEIKQHPIAGDFEQLFDRNVISEISYNSILVCIKASEINLKRR